MQLQPFTKKHTGGLVLVALLLPLCFLSIRHSHDWGDDFAQYINQARCIAGGKPVSATGYIYNSHYPMLGPAAYPQGFPLLLSPVYAICGNSIPAFNVYLSLWLVLAGFVWYLVLRQFHSAFNSVLLVLLWAWHPWVLEFKAEVMAEIPFTALLGLFLLMHLRWFENAERKSTIKLIAFGLVAALLVAVRLPGAVIIAAWPVYILSFSRNTALYTKGNKAGQTLMLIGAPVLAAIVGFVIINFGIGRLASKDLISYGGNFEGGNLIHTVRDNLYYYGLLAQDFFHRSRPTWKIFPLLTQALVLALCVIGFINQTAKKRGFAEWAFVVYLLLLLVYPYRGSGFRFLLPVAPLIFHYAAQGFKSIQWGFRLPVKVWAVGLSFILILQYLPEQVMAIKTAKNTFPGPQEKESTETFHYIKENTPQDAVILFRKPRALALYTGRKSFANATGNQWQTWMVKDLERFNPSYILIHTEISGAEIKQWAESHPLEWQKTWSNNKFTLYSKKTL